MFCSFKGEGTGAVRHMFSHYVLKPERTPLEAHPWGTPASSGSFSTLFQSRLLRAQVYKLAPTDQLLKAEGVVHRRIVTSHRSDRGRRLARSGTDARHDVPADRRLVAHRPA